MAAQFSVLIRPHSKTLADRFLKSALRALEYALQEKAEPYPIRIDFKTKEVIPNTAVYYEKIVWALAECYRATNDPRYAQLLASFFPDTRHRLHPAAMTGTILWPLVRNAHALPPAVAEEARKMLMDMADDVLRKTQLSAYRLGTGIYIQPASWGSASPGHFGDLLARAHALTRDPKYLDALALNYDVLFGANPPGKSFVTSMGFNPP